MIIAYIMNNYSKIGVIHGRFQILHNDHLKYLLSGKSLCQHLVVGVTNPDPFLTKTDSSDPERSDSLANPLTFFERYTLIRSALTEAGISLSDFSIVPFPINFPHLYRYYVPLEAKFFLTIYDEWGQKKLKYFQSLGLNIHILWEVPKEKKGISASQIRKKMINNLPWKHLVPNSVSNLLLKWEIPHRLQKLQAKRKMG